MPNRLARETSPYLLQHADNPVDWYPWGEEAFELARQTGKPVLLSIGYSACHWCHVMAHESFEDDKTAELMNDLFVNIKVDREERPDVDKIYQTAHQLLTQRGGGWPLTMFLSPDDQRPFFGGTYFPNEARYGMPSFGELLQKVSDYYNEQGDAIRDQGERLNDVLDRLIPETAPDGLSLNDEPIGKLRKLLTDSFDYDYGGHGGAPKFPHPGTIEWLLRAWRQTANDEEPDVDALFMASLTLTRMADGGIFDHVGGGFCRYSVDRYWQIPHFEKMLYDNGALLATYSLAHLATGEELFAKTANLTADWMLADMRSPEGGFYAAYDADSEGEEGKFYVWTPEEVSALLGDEQFELYSRRFGLDKEANFEGKWHLTVREAVDDPNRLIDEAHEILLAERNKRVPPGRDDKQLTSWNALAIRGMAIAGRVLQRDELVDAAVAATDFVRDKLIVDGRLFASYKESRARFPAYLDDHAFLLDAILELLQSRWETAHLQFAIELADLLLEHFEDKDAGGFYFTANDHESLMHRPKPLADEAVPSGNGVAAFALQRLGHLVGEHRYIEAAEKALRAAWQAMDEYPHGHVTLITALEEYLRPPEFIIIRGDDEVSEWCDSLNRIYLPSRMVFAIGRDEELPGLLMERVAVDGETVAYRCAGTTCDLPTKDYKALARSLS
ncbi:MAG: thioredoxin domain-containing protein [Woeseiaceae bacterium]